MKALLIFFVYMATASLATADVVKSASNWIISPRLSKLENMESLTMESIHKGKAIYLNECQKCHGKFGKGDGEMAAFFGDKVADLTSQAFLKQSDGAIYTKIRTGRSPMPGFKNAISKEDVWHLVNFIRNGFESDQSGIKSKKIIQSKTKDIEKTKNNAHLALSDKNQFPSAQECGMCHQQIYREWSVSRHAAAQLSPTFLAYQATLVKLTKGTLGDFCERCHTEIGMSSGEPILTNNKNRSKAAQEGITCVTCHRVKEAYGKITGRLPLETGGIKNPVFGPRSGAEFNRVVKANSSTSLNTHKEARLLDQVSQPGFCARCHDVRLVNGVRFEDLFSEYKQTPAAKRGAKCQSCHMGPVSGISSEYPPASAAVVRGEYTKPAHRTNHMFPGPDSSLIHPGVFPINPEAQEFATPEEWNSFDFEGGWGTEKFEKSVTPQTKFPGFWSDRDERIAAREIIDHQLELLNENRARATTLMKNGYGLGEIKITESEDDIAFDVEVKNLTDGHSVPSGLIAERNVFLQVNLTDAQGKVLFQSGDLDPNGDVRDTHSLYVQNGTIPRDGQLFNLRSPILVGTLNGGEREQVLPANYSLNPLIFVRPSETPSLLFGGIRDLRLQKKSIEVLGKRQASYLIERKLLSGNKPYHINIKLVAGQLPPHLINAIADAGFDYGLTAQKIGNKLVDLYRVLWEKEIVIH